MGRSRRETIAISQRRQIVADLYVQGWPQTAIAKHIGMSQPTICDDLQAIHAEWQKTTIRDFDTARDLELRKLERVEREAWAAWERSQKPSQSATISTDGGDQRTQKTVKDQCGDPRYLSEIIKCVASRRALLGLDQPTKIAPTSPDGEEAYHTHVMAELMRLAEQSKDGPEIIDARFICEVVDQQAIEHRPDEQPPDPTEGNGQDG